VTAWPHLDRECHYTTDHYCEGAFFKGVIDIHTPGQGNDEMVAPGISTTSLSSAAPAIKA
jgi:hypothetical protein